MWFLLVELLNGFVKQDGSGIHTPLLTANKFKNPSQNGNEVENEESISDADLENIVGVGDNSELEVLSFFKNVYRIYFC